MPGTNANDPTTRTVEQIAAAVKNIEDQIAVAVKNIEAKTDLRFQANDDAVKLLQDFANRQPTTEAVDGKLSSLKELTAAQFQALTELINAKADGTKLSLDAALVTRKEASDKLENTINKQLEGLAKRIDDLKERIDTGEGRGTGRTDFIAWIVAAVAVVGFALNHFTRAKQS